MTEQTPQPAALSRRDFLKITLGTAAATTAVGMTMGYVAWDYEPFNLEIKLLELTLPRLAPQFDGYRLVQFSDIHLGTWMTSEWLAHIVGLVNAQQADMIVITGDYVTIGDIPKLADYLIHPLSQLQARDGKLAILGNHDHWTNAPAVREILAASNLTELDNAVWVLERDNARLNIGGIDDYWEAKDNLDAVLRGMPDNGAAILLAHEPDYADISARTGRFDLQLSGHSHGGQVVIPFVGPPQLPNLGRKYHTGLYQVGSMIQYTNRGVGMVSPTVRFNCRPEITVFTLRAPNL